MAKSSQEAKDLAWSPDAHCLALDGVRGFAILMVTLYRLCKELDPSSHPVIATVRRFAPIGERGVDLFFVLSGFLITGILLRSKGSPHYFRNFIVRRVLRIFPLYFLSLVIGLWILPWVLNTHAFDMPKSEQFYLWVYMSNVRMSWLNAWCFGPFDHFWSLAVEEHFYFVWPALVLWLSIKRLASVCIGTIGVVAIARTFAAMNPSFAVAIDILTVFRVDALAMGALLAIILSSSIPHPRIRTASLFAVIIFFPFAIGIASTGTRFLGVSNTLCPMIFMAGLAILLQSPRRSRFVQFFESLPLRLLGKYSYGMYVVQLPLVTLLPLSEWVGWLPEDAITRSILYMTTVFGLIAAAAVLSYNLLE